jgi:hypothetical protein
MIDVYVVNALTGEVVTRDFTEAETEQRQLDKIAATVQAQAAADRQTLKTATLAKLGLTADEVAALLS